MDTKTPAMHLRVVEVELLFELDFHHLCECFSHGAGHSFVRNTQCVDADLGVDGQPHINSGLPQRLALSNEFAGDFVGC